jgi:hypothetical protein
VLGVGDRVKDRRGEEDSREGNKASIEEEKLEMT